MLASYLFLTATAFLQLFHRRVLPRPHLCRLQNHVRVLNRIACPDQANRQWDALSELRVRLKCNRSRAKTLLEAVYGIRTVGAAEFLRHHDFPNNEVSLNSPENIQNARNIIDQRNIHGFNLRPERKSPVGNNQGVRVTNAAQQRIDSRIKNSIFQHRHRLLMPLYNLQPNSSQKFGLSHSLITLLRLSRLHPLTPQIELRLVNPNGHFRTTVAIRSQEFSFLLGGRGFHIQQPQP
jgi:hypothetical protein